MSCSSDESGTNSSSTLKIDNKRFVPKDNDGIPCITTYAEFDAEHNVNIREFWLMRDNDTYGYQGVIIFVHFDGDDVSGTYQLGGANIADGTGYVSTEYQEFGYSTAQQGTVIIEDLGNNRYRIEFPQILNMVPDLDTGTYTLRGSYEGDFFVTPEPNHFGSQRSVPK